MIVAEFKNVPQVERYLKSLPNKIERAAERTMRTISIDLQTYVKSQKLSGQVLKNRTGNLRRAIAQRVEVIPQKSIAAFVGVQPNAKYGRIHEFGGEISVPAVSGKLMVFEKDGKTIFTTKHRAFTVNMPQRSFLRSSLAENRQRFVLRLRESVAESVRKV